MFWGTLFMKNVWAPGAEPLVPAGPRIPRQFPSFSKLANHMPEQYKVISFNHIFVHLIDYMSLGQFFVVLVFSQSCLPFETKGVLVTQQVTTWYLWVLSQTVHHQPRILWIKYYSLCFGSLFFHMNFFYHFRKKKSWMRLELNNYYFYIPISCALHSILTLSVPVVLLNSPNLSSYFSLNKFERILLLIFNGLSWLINMHFLITKCLILYVFCKEKLFVDNWLGLKGFNWSCSFLNN